MRAAASHNVRTPSIRQLYDVDGGNADLQFEQADNYSIGADFEASENSTLSLTFFRTNVRDFIERDDTTRLFENNQRYRFQGVEMGVNSMATDDLRLRFGYTYLDAYDESPANDGVRLQYRPRHKASLEGYWTFVPRWYLYAGVLYVADQITNSRGSVATEQLNLGEYTILNTKLNWQVPTTTANLYVGVDNVLDENYEESYAFPQSGRFVYAGASAYF